MSDEFSGQNVQKTAFSKCLHLENDNQIGLELSSSRGNSYNDLTTVINEVVHTPTLNTLTEEFMFENKLVTPISPNKKLTRPISYSDSFLVLSTSGSINNSGIQGLPGISGLPGNPGFTRLQSDQSLALLEPFLPRDISGSGNQNQNLANQTQNQNPEVKYKESQLVNKLISITVHISLISVFENIFFWQFISKSEDTALQTTIDGFLQSTLNQCYMWPQNATQLIKALFDLFVNETQIAVQANQAYQARSQINYNLFVQSWLYYVGLVSFVIIQASIVHCKKYKIKCREIPINKIRHK
jgi:hypothetical protein